MHNILYLHAQRNPLIPGHDVGFETASSMQFLCFNNRSCVTVLCLYRIDRVHRASKEIIYILHSIVALVAFKKLLPSDRAVYPPWVAWWTRPKRTAPMPKRCLSPINIASIQTHI